MNQKILAWVELILGILALGWSVYALAMHGSQYLPPDSTLILLVIGLFILLHGIRDLYTSSTSSSVMSIPSNIS